MNGHLPTLPEMARALGGVVAGKQILAPGPGHSREDRSLSVALSDANPEGFVVHSLAGNDPLECRDHVRQKLGLPEWKPNGKPALVRTITYDFCDPDTGERRYQKERKEYADGTKDIRFKPKRNGPALLYGAERLKRAREETPIFIVEGEKKVDAITKLGSFAVCTDAGAKSEWLPQHVELLRGRRIILWPDSDEAGEKYISNAAAAIRAAYPDADIRVIRPFGLPNGAKGKDVCDWTGDAFALRGLIESATPYEGSAKKTQASFEADGITGEALMGMEFPPVKYIVPGLFVEGATILAGAPKLGKSWMALEIALAVATGGECLGDIKCEQGDVLYIALEDNQRRLQSRLKKLIFPLILPGVKQERPKLDRLHLHTKWPRASDGGIAAIRKWLESHPAARMVAVDVLAMFRDARDGKSPLYDGDYLAVKALQELAAEFGVGILILHHTRKGGAEDPLEEISGTLGISGAADAALVLKRDSGGVRLAGRGRDLEEEIDKAVTFDRSTARWRVEGEASDVRKTDERKTILDALKEAGEPIGPTDLAAETGMAPGNIRFLLHKMAKDGDVQRVGYGRYTHPANTPNTANTPEEDEANQGVEGLTARVRANTGANSRKLKKPSKIRERDQSVSAVSTVSGGAA